MAGKVTAELLAAIRAAHEAGATVREIGARFGLGKSTVHRVLSGEIPASALPVPPVPPAPSATVSGDTRRARVVEWPPLRGPDPGPPPIPADRRGPYPLRDEEPRLGDRYPLW